jgi:hypothetical protein
MTRIVLRAAQVLVFPTLVLLAALALAPGRKELAGHLYILFLCSAALVVLLTGLRRAYPPVERSLVEAVLDWRPEADERLPQLARIEREVTLATSNAFDVHFRLRPALRETARGLLGARRGVDLDTQPERARELLGEETWELVRPDREPPRNRMAPGVDVAAIRRSVEALERLT